MKFIYESKPLALFLSKASYYVHIISQGNHGVKGPHDGKKSVNALKRVY